MPVLPPWHSLAPIHPPAAHPPPSRTQGQWTGSHPLAVTATRPPTQECLSVCPSTPHPSRNLSSYSLLGMTSQAFICLPSQEAKRRAIHPLVPSFPSPSIHRQGHPPICPPTPNPGTSVQPSIPLLIHPSMGTAIQLPTHPQECPSTHPLNHPSTHRNVHPSTQPRECPSTQPSIHPPTQNTHPPIPPSVYLSIRPSTQTEHPALGPSRPPMCPLLHPALPTPPIPASDANGLGPQPMHSPQVTPPHPGHREDQKPSAGAG